MRETGRALLRRQGQRKQFFFEKKNQKTFTHCVTWLSGDRVNNQKFFGSFFQKRTASFLRRFVGASGG
jgi:hypothetical protein